MDWIIDILIKKGGPSFIRGAVLGIFGWILAKQGALATFGIIADQASHTITIHLDQLNMALIAGLPAIMAAIIKIVNHQASAVVTKATQTPPQ
jgi:hypothetical protein